jgi:hypothetical protein
MVMVAIMVATPLSWTLAALMILVEPRRQTGDKHLEDSRSWSRGSMQAGARLTAAAMRRDEDGRHSSLLKIYLHSHWLKAAGLCR